MHIGSNGKYMKISTKMPIFGPVVLEIAGDISIGYLDGFHNSNKYFMAYHGYTVRLHQYVK